MKLNLKIRFTAIMLLLALVMSAVTAVAAETEEEEKTPEELGAEIYDYELPNCEDVQTLSSNVVLYCLDTDKMLYRKNENKITEPGPFTKIMAGALALELYRDRLDEEITVTEELVEGAFGISIYLEVGEKIKINDLLYALLMKGANDAALVLSRLYDGNSETFVSMMNEMAKKAGAKNTMFKNVTGLHADGVSTTLRDSVKIAKYAYGVEGFIDYTSTEKYVIPETNLSKERSIITRNYLLSTRTDLRYKTTGVLGMMYGSSAECGECLMVCVQRGGLTYFIGISDGFETTDGYGDKTVYLDAHTLIEHAENDFGYIKVVSSKTAIAEVRVKYNSVSDHVSIVPVTDITLYMPLEAKGSEDLVNYTVTYERTVSAPVEEGQELGVVVVRYKDCDLCSVPAVAKESLQKNRILYAIDRIEEITKSRFFIYFLLTFVALLVLWLIISSATNSFSRKRKKKKLR